MKNIIIFCFPFFDKNMYLVALVVFLNLSSGCLPRGDYTVIKLLYVAVWSKFIRLIIPHVFFMMIIYSPNIIEGFGYKGTRLTGKRDTCVDNSPATWEECAQGYWNTEECVCMCVLSCLWLCDPMDSPGSVGFSRQEHWNALPFSSPRSFLDPGVEPTSLALAGGFFYHWATTDPTEERGTPLRQKVPGKDLVELMVHDMSHESSIRILDRRGTGEEEHQDNGLHWERRELTFVKHLLGARHYMSASPSCKPIFGLID